MLLLYYYLFYIKSIAYAEVIIGKKIIQNGTKIIKNIKTSNGILINKKNNIVTQKNHYISSYKYWLGLWTSSESIRIDSNNIAQKSKWVSNINTNKNKDQYINFYSKKNFKIIRENKIKNNNNIIIRTQILFELLGENFWKNNSK